MKLNLKYILLILLLLGCNDIIEYDSENIIENYENYEVINSGLINLTRLDIGTQLNNPWGLEFINDNEILITEKNGNLIYANLKTNKNHKIEHDIPVATVGQGGLLDLKFYDDFLYVSFSIKNDDDKYTTAIGKGTLSDDFRLLKNFEILFKAKPFYSSGKHFGSRIIIKDNYLFATIGERGQGDVGQDLNSHAGSIIRINLDGSAPENPFKTDLKEIFMVGVRNPQGMALSKKGELIISNHGAKGGDFIGQVERGSNYGWNQIGWGGTNYTGTKIGDGSPFKKEFKYPLLSWVPSIAPSDLIFYYGNEFPDWNGDILVTSLKYKLLIKLEYKNGKIIDKHIIFKDKIGRLRDVDINSNGEIFIITDELNSSVWKLSSN
tara:strand:+ start:11633 stop:12769 length:1137 start_codon:yes stop_codon:yes gene_type:complete